MEEFSEASRDEEEEKEPRLTKAMRTRWAGRLMAPPGAGVPTVTPMIATRNSHVAMHFLKERKPGEREGSGGKEGRSEAATRTERNGVEMKKMDIRQLPRSREVVVQLDRS